MPRQPAGHQGAFRSSRNAASIPAGPIFAKPLFAREIRLEVVFHHRHPPPPLRVACAWRATECQKMNERSFALMFFRAAFRSRFTLRARDNSRAPLLHSWPRRRPFGTHADLRIIRPAREAWIRLLSTPVFAAVPEGWRSRERGYARAEPGRAESWRRSMERLESALAGQRHRSEAAAEIDEPAAALGKRDHIDLGHQHGMRADLENVLQPARQAGQRLA